MGQIISNNGSNNVVSAFLKGTDWNAIANAASLIAMVTPCSAILVSVLRVRGSYNQIVFKQQVSRSLAELKNYMSTIDRKMDMVLQADMEAGLMALQSAVGSDVESLSKNYLSNAVSFFMRAISQEQNTRKVQALFNLGLCQFLQGDYTNGWGNLFNSIKTPYVESKSETEEQFMENRQNIQNSLATVIQDAVPFEDRHDIPLLNGSVCSSDELVQLVNSAADGDVIKLFPTQYDLKEPLVIKNNISFVPLFPDKQPVIVSELKEPIVFQKEGATFEKIVFIRNTDSENADVPFFSIQNASPIFNSCTFLSKQNAVAIQGADSNPGFNHCLFVGAASNHVLISDDALGSFDNCEFETGGTAVTLENGANPLFNSCLIHNVDNGVNLLEGASGQFKSCDIFDYHSSGVKITGNTQTGFENCNIHSDKDEHKIALPLYDEKDSLVTSSFKTAYKGFSSGFNAIKSSFWKPAKNNDPPVPAVVESNQNDDSSGSAVIGLVLKSSAKGSFKSCSFYGNNDNIIYVDEGSSVTLDKCLIHNGKKNGVYVTQESKAELNGCSLESCSENDIFVDNKGIVVCNECKISSAGKAGVYCTSSGECRFSQCEVFKNDYSGFVLDNNSNVCVDKCVINQNCNFGITINTGAGGSFTNNKLKDNKSIIGAGSDWNLAPDVGSVLREGNTPNA